MLTLDDIKRNGDWQSGRKIMTGKGTLDNSYSTDSAYSVCKVVVAGYRRVCFPSVPGTNLVGSVFVDSDETVLEEVMVPTLNSRF